MVGSEKRESGKESGSRHSFCYSVSHSVNEPGC